MSNRVPAVSIDDKLDNIIARLERIEQRQIKTTEMVTDVKAQEAPVIGSFGTIDSGKAKE